MKYDLKYSLPVPNGEKIEWKESIHFQKEFLLIGITSSNFLGVCRGNLQGDVDFHIWEEKIDDWENIVIQAQPEITNTILVLNKDYQFFEEKIFRANDVFSESMVVKGLPKIFEAQPYLLPNSICINAKQEYILFKDEQLYFFNDKFEFKENEFRENLTNAANGETQFSQKKVVENITKNNHYYLYDQNTIISIDCVAGSINLYDEIITDNITGARLNILGIYQFHNDKEYQKFVVTNEGVFSQEKNNHSQLSQVDEFTERIYDAYKTLDNFLVILISGFDRDDVKVWFRVEVFEIKKKTLKLKHQFDLKDSIQAILPSSERGKYYFLEASGNIVSYEKRFSL